MGPPISVGVLVEETLSVWQVRALETMLNESDAQIAYVVVNRAEDTFTDKFERVRRAKAYVVIAGLRRFSTAVHGEQGLHRSMLVEDVECLADAEVVECVPTPSAEFGVELPAETVERVSNCDVIVRFGFGIIKGRILTVPQHGVLSYHHGDIRRYRGRPAGFWEFMHGVDETGITLQKLSSELDKGNIAVYRSIDISQSEPYQSIRRRLFEESIDMLATAITDIEQGTYDPANPDTTGDLYTAPSFTEYLQYLSKNIPLRLRHRLHSE